MSKPLKILQVNKLYAPVIGGVETIVRAIAEGLNGVADMRVLVCQPKGRRADAVLNGVKVTYASCLGTFLSMPLSFDFFRRYAELARGADIIQLHSPFPLSDLAVLLFGCKCAAKSKLVVWWHSDIVRQRVFSVLLKPVIRHTLARADLIVAADVAIADSSAYLFRYRDKCRIIPFGMDLSEYPEPGDKDFLTRRMNDTSKVKLLFAGRLVYYKGVDVLIKAMAGVEGAELFIAGRGPLERKLVKMSHRLSICGKLHFLGNLPHDELLCAFYDSDVFVFPSVARSEAFGLVQLEAMCYGKPVINTDLPTAVPHVSMHGETGLTVKAGDGAALAVAINLLVSDGDLRRVYGANAAKRVRDKFDRRRMLAELYDCYQGLYSEYREHRGNGGAQNED